MPAGSCCYRWLTLLLPIALATHAPPAHPRFEQDVGARAPVDPLAHLDTIIDDLLQAEFDKGQRQRHTTFSPKHVIIRRESFESDADYDLGTVPLEESPLRGLFNSPQTSSPSAPWLLQADESSPASSTENTGSRGPPSGIVAVIVIEVLASITFNAVSFVIWLKMKGRLGGLAPSPSSPSAQPKRPFTKSVTDLIAKVSGRSLSSSKSNAKGSASVKSTSVKSTSVKSTSAKRPKTAATNNRPTIVEKQREMARRAPPESLTTLSAGRQKAGGDLASGSWIETVTGGVEGGPWASIDALLEAGFLDVPVDVDTTATLGTPTPTTDQTPLSWADIPL